MEQVIYANISNNHDVNTGDGSSMATAFTMHELYDYLNQEVGVADVIRVKVKGSRTVTSSYYKESISVNRQIFTQTPGEKGIVFEGYSNDMWQLQGSGTSYDIVAVGPEVESVMVFRFASMRSVDVHYDEQTSMNFYSSHFTGNLHCFLNKSDGWVQGDAHVSPISEFSNCNFDTTHHDIFGFWDGEAVETSHTTYFNDCLFKWHTVSVSHGSDKESIENRYFDCYFTNNVFSYSSDAIKSDGFCITNWTYHPTIFNAGFVDGEFDISSILIDPPMPPMTNRNHAWEANNDLRDSLMNRSVTVGGYDRTFIGAAISTSVSSTIFITTGNLELITQGIAVTESVNDTTGHIGAFYFSNHETISVDTGVVELLPMYVDVEEYVTDTIPDQLIVEFISDGMSISNHSYDMHLSTRLIRLVGGEFSISDNLKFDVQLTLGKNRVYSGDSVKMSALVSIRDSYNFAYTVSQYLWVIVDRHTNDVVSNVTTLTPSTLHDFTPSDSNQYHDGDYEVYVLATVVVDDVEVVIKSNIELIVYGIRSRTKIRFDAEKVVELMRYMPDEMMGTDVGGMINMMEDFLNQMYETDIGVVRMDVEDLKTETETHTNLGAGASHQTQVNVVSGSTILGRS